MKRFKNVLRLCFFFISIIIISILLIMSNDNIITLLRNTTTLDEEAISLLSGIIVISFIAPVAILIYRVLGRFDNHK